MNQQAREQAQQELRAIICGIFEHVHRKEKENAILSASMMECPAEKSDAGYTAKML